MKINQDNITKAWFFASRIHNGQLYPGEQLPYLIHLGNVMMEIMAVSDSLENPELAISCAILHDSIEDTSVGYDEIKKAFGKEIADGVMALTKSDSFETKQEKMLDSLERIKKQPKEIWAVKMADRIANLGEPPHYWEREKVQAYQNEARVILKYLAKGSEPLADRLHLKIDEYNQYII